MQMLKVDPEGFDDLDRRLLNLIIENFDGGPVGVESLAAALSEERGTLEDVIEPYLIQQGFLVRTARGRMASHKAYRHLGLRPRGDSGLGIGRSEEHTSELQSLMRISYAVFCLKKKKKKQKHTCDSKQPITTVTCTDMTNK